MLRHSRLIVREHLDTMETYFDSHLDLLQRQIQKHSDRLKMKAEVALKKRAQSGDFLTENFDREIKNFKLKVCCIYMYTFGMNPLCVWAGVRTDAVPRCLVAVCEGC